MRNDSSFVPFRMSLAESFELSDLFVAPFSVSLNKSFDEERNRMVFKVVAENQSKKNIKLDLATLLRAELGQHASLIEERCLLMDIEVKALNQCDICSVLRP